MRNFTFWVYAIQLRFTHSYGVGEPVWYSEEEPPAKGSFERCPSFRTVSKASLFDSLHDSLSCQTFRLDTTGVLFSFSPPNTEYRFYHRHRMSGLKSHLSQCEEPSKAGTFFAWIGRQGKNLTTRGYDLGDCTIAGLLTAFASISVCCRAKRKKQANQHILVGGAVLLLQFEFFVFLVGALG